MTAPFYTDLHMHTHYCDGHSTPEEYALEAMKRGLKAIGFSAHSYTGFDESYCIPKDKIAAYRQEIAALRERYKEKICILCGIELDAFSDMDTEDFDYTVGSCHYVKKNGMYYAVDHTRELFKEAVNTGFSGDVYAFCEAYYEGVASLAERQPDVIGHFDLVTKFNEGEAFFSEQHPRYIAAWKAACDRLLPLGVPFEVNTGAVSRGYRDAPYPSRDILLYIREKGGQVILSSDSHKKENLGFGFAEIEKSLKAIGFMPKASADALLAKIEAKRK